MDPAGFIGAGPPPPIMISRRCSVSVFGAEVGGEISCTYAYDIFSILGYPNHVHMNGHMSRRQNLRANNMSSHDIFWHTRVSLGIYE